MSEEDGETYEDVVITSARATGLDTPTHASGEDGNPIEVFTIGELKNACFQL